MSLEPPCRCIIPIVMGVEGAKGHAFPELEQSDDADTAGTPPPEASAPADMTTIVARLICSAPYFVVYLSEIVDRNHKVHFPAAALKLESQGLGLFVQGLECFGPKEGAAASAGLFDRTSIKRVGPSTSFFIKRHTHGIWKGCAGRWGLSTLMYPSTTKPSCTQLAPSQAKLSKHLSLLPGQCSWPARLALRRGEYQLCSKHHLCFGDLKNSDKGGASEKAAKAAKLSALNAFLNEEAEMTKVSQSCHTTSMILACCSHFITRFYSTASPHFPKVHHALLQLGILYKKKMEPAKWASVPLLEDVQVAPAPPSPPERPAS